MYPSKYVFLCRLPIEVASLDITLNGGAIEAPRLNLKEHILWGLK